MASGGATAATRRQERGRESEWRSVFGSGGEGKRGWAHLVADQGASTPAHARHAPAERYRRATARGAAVRARGRCAGAGEGVTRGWAGPASASGPDVRPRPASAPLSLFPFFKYFFSKKLKYHF